MLINHAAITVKDMDKSKKFYGDALGLTQTFDDWIPVTKEMDAYAGEKNLKMRVVLFADENGSMVELFEVASPKTKIRPTEHLRYPSTGLNELSFIVEDVEEVGKKLRAQGFDFWGPALDFVAMGVRTKQYIALDPDGVMVEFVEIVGTVE